MPDLLPAAGLPSESERLLHTLERLLALEALNLPTLLTQAATLLAAALRADTLDTWLYEPTALALRAVGASATPMGRRQQALGLDRLPVAAGGRTVEVFQTGQPYHTGHLDADPGELPTLVADLGAHSKLTLAFSVAGTRRGVLEALAAAPDAFSAADAAFLGVAAGWIGTLVQRAALLADHTASLAAEVAERQAVEAELRAATTLLAVRARQVLAVQEAERRAIARELHDEIGQSLTGLQFLLDVAGTPAASVPLSEARAIVRDLLRRVSDLALDLRPAILDDLGLLPALLWALDRHKTCTGQAVAFRHRGLDRRFPPDLETAVYRVVQEVLRRVRTSAPHTRVILLSLYGQEPYVLEALRHGAAGYVLKEAGTAAVLEAVAAVAAGRRYLSPPLTERAIDRYLEQAQAAVDPLDPYEQLTAREREILHLAAQSATNAAIAARLSISPRTVETHRTHLMRKLGLHTPTDLLRYAQQRGLLADPAGADPADENTGSRGQERG